jgi:hypothetical protein
LKKSFFCFVDAIVTDKLVSMGIYESFLFQDYHSAGLKLPFYVAPNDVILNKTVI